MSKICPNCNKEYESGKFCLECGSALVEKARGVVCPKCGAVNPEGSRFCQECGEKLIEKDFAAAVDDYNNGLYESAVASFEKLAQQGHAEAERMLGNCYLYGRGVPQDDQKAVVLFRKAAENGDPKALFNLGYCYDYGLGIPQDHQKAVEWYLKAAEYGVPRAQFNLGVCYDNGWGVPQDYQKAVEWYLLASEQNDPDACYALARIYRYGAGAVNVDLEKAKYFAEKAENLRPGIATDFLYGAELTSAKVYIDNTQLYLLFSCDLGLSLESVACAIELVQNEYVVSTKSGEFMEWSGYVHGAQTWQTCFDLPQISDAADGNTEYILNFCLDKDEDGTYAHIYEIPVGLRHISHLFSADEWILDSPISLNQGDLVALDLAENEEDDE